jgi:hypothetical protein
MPDTNGRRDVTRGDARRQERGEETRRAETRAGFDLGRHRGRREEGRGGDGYASNVRTRCTEKRREQRRRRTRVYLEGADVVPDGVECLPTGLCLGRGIVELDHSVGLRHPTVQHRRESVGPDTCVATAVGELVNGVSARWRGGEMAGHVRRVSE